MLEFRTNLSLRHTEQGLVLSLSLTHCPVFGKQHVHWYINTEIEDVHVIFDCHLQLCEWGHLHDGPSWVDGEEGGSSGDQFFSLQLSTTNIHTLEQ